MNTLKFILLSLISLYILLGIGVYFFQEKLIFLPEELPEDFTYEFDQPFEELFIEMNDGAKLNALHFKPPNAKGLIIYFHGNAGSLARWGEVVAPFVLMGYEVLIPDYRGYGKSTGKRTAKRMLIDAEVLYQEALKQTSEEKIIVFGRSLGSSFASHLGGKMNPSKVILETPFYSLSDVAKKIIPIYPQSWLLRFNFKNYKSLRKKTSPVFIFHGTEDEVVPFESGKKLFDSLPGSGNVFHKIVGGHHNDLSSFTAYWIEMEKVLGNE